MKHSIALCALFAAASGEDADGTTMLQMQLKAKKSAAHSLLQSAHALTQKINDGQDPEACAQAAGAARQAVEAALPAITSAHSHHQNTINIAAAAVEQCASRELHGLAMVSAQGPNLQAARTEHATCRQTEQDLQAGLSACDQYEQLRNTLGGSVCYSLPVGDEGTGWLVAVWGGKEALETAYNQGAPLQEACANAREALALQQQECAAAQNRFEEDYCSYRASCADLQICRASAEENYHAIEADVQEAMADVVAEYLVMKHVECLLGNADTALETESVISEEVVAECSTPADTSELNINYQTFDALTTCDSNILTRAPCGENFLSFEYAAMVQRDTIMAACTECAPLPLAGAPQSWLRQHGVVDLDNIQPAEGSPDSCTCTLVELSGDYSAGPIVRCDNCIDTYRSTDPNSCPAGFKIYSPRSSQDWQTLSQSLDLNEFRSPFHIVDVTRPENGCGGCVNHPMNSESAGQSSWVTSDGSPWFLRHTAYGEPNGDYTANCYLAIFDFHNGEMTLNDGSCSYHSNKYLCQLDQSSFSISSSGTRSYGDASTPGPWTLILQYSDPYSPTREAVGELSEQGTGFAKKSDEEINALTNEGMDFNYYWLTSEASQGDTNLDITSTLIRIPISHQYDDTALSSFSHAQWCLNAPDFEHVDRCTSWSGDEGPILDNYNALGGGSVDPNDCRRWFQGHGQRQCYTPTTFQGDYNKRCYSSGHRCVNSRGASNHPERLGVKIYKFVL